MNPSSSPRRARAWLLLGAVAIMASTSSYAESPRLALNAPSCAQEIENYRRECLRKCENNPIKAQCERSCNDPDKLSPKLVQCEERDKKKPAA